ncbi:MAG: prepilin peptidase [Parvibaculum sp.]|uniref:prepilin peptidase n=1 Tax=Parvibaculum sp. TaxID=2024848 RepID=UPI00284B5923|nr:prepilin peptidase [Parvibaculum sp.]MDR3498731.1 prepilin peptidase [Parvibaculum sp.]
MATTDFPGLLWLLPVIVAPFIGSFLGVLVVRLPGGERVIFTRSVCPHCETQLRPLDLFPLLSWLALRGRCRHCAARIGIFYRLIELAALAVALWAAAVTSDGALLATCLLG